MFCAGMQDRSLIYASNCTQENNDGSEISENVKSDNKRQKSEMAAVRVRGVV